MLRVFVLSLSLLLVSPSMGHDEKHYADMPKDVLEWFKSQTVPGGPNKGARCCNERDGTYAEEDIRDGVYWTRFEQTKGAWIPVPPDVVIHDPNRNGAPVVWWYYESGPNGEVPKVKCYAPGAGL